MVRYYTGILDVHYAILAIALVGFLEAACWWSLLAFWNVVGQEPIFFHCLAVAMTVIKYSAALFYIALVSDGWGVTKDNALGDRSINYYKMLAIVVLTSGASFVRESYVARRHYYQIPRSIVAPVVMLPLVVYACILACIFPKHSRFLAEAKTHGLEKLNDTLQNVRYGVHCDCIDRLRDAFPPYGHLRTFRTCAIHVIPRH